MATEAFIAKLEAFAETLDPEEQEVLGEILQHSLSEEEVEGHAAFGSRSKLGNAIFSAQNNNKTFTHLQLNKAAEGIVLVAAGPVVGGGALNFNR